MLLEILSLRKFEKIQKSLNLIPSHYAGLQDCFFSPQYCPAILEPAHTRLPRESEDAANDLQFIERECAPLLQAITNPDFAASNLD